MSQQPLSERFAHLLKPYKDLSENFGIDLATELEEYIKELQQASLRLTEAGFTGSLNFAEAAMLVQGSAQVYSKKVEYLHSLIFSVMDNVLKRKTKAARAASSIGPGGEDLDVDSDEPFLHAPDAALTEASVDLDVPTESYATLRRPLLLAAPPLTLLSTAADLLNTTPSLPQAGFKLSQLRVGSDGALLLDTDSTSLSHSAVLHGSADAGGLPFGSPLRGERARGDWTKLESMAVTPSRPLGHAAGISEGDAMMKSEEVWVGGAVDDGDEYDYTAPDGDVVATKDEDELVRLPKAYQPTSVSTLALEEPEHINIAADLLPAILASATAGVGAGKGPRGASALWAKLDPYDDDAAVIKPMKRGRNITIPKEPSPEGNDAPLPSSRSSLAAPPVLLEAATEGHDVALTVTARSIRCGALALPVHEDFAGAFVKRAAAARAAVRARARTRSRRTKAAVDALAKDREAVFDDNLDDSYAGNYDDGDDNMGVGELVRDIQAAGELAAASTAAALEGADAGTGAGEGEEWLSIGGGVGTGTFAKRLEAAALDAEDNHAADESSQLVDVDTELAGLTQSYQDACKAHVEQYLHLSEKFRNESTMARRIREWEQRLEPLLKEQEARGHFDIFEYGTSVITSVKQLGSLVPEAPLPAPIPASTPVAVPQASLMDAMRGQPRHEVCRLFLSTLQLANAGNVDMFVDPEYLRSNDAHGARARERERDGGRRGTGAVDPYSFTVDIAGGDSSRELVPASRVVLRLLKEERHRTDEDELELGGAAVPSRAMMDDVVVHADQKKGRGKGKARGKGKGKAKIQEDVLDDFVVSDEEEGLRSVIFGEDSEEEGIGRGKRKQNSGRGESSGKGKKGREVVEEEEEEFTESDTDGEEEEEALTSSSSSSSSSSVAKRPRRRESKPTRYLVDVDSETHEEEEEEPKPAVRKGKRRIEEA